MNHQLSTNRCLLIFSLLLLLLLALARVGTTLYPKLEFSVSSVDSSPKIVKVVYYIGNNFILTKKCLKRANFTFFVF